LEGYNFGDAGRQIYEFLWDEYADWYIEVSKTRMRVRARAGVCVCDESSRVLLRMCLIQIDLQSHLFLFPLSLFFRREGTS
jgi:valyl-tRNA synthetase